MNKSRFIGIFLTLLLFSTVHADMTCELTSEENIIYHEILDKIDKDEFDLELYKILPRDYMTFSKIFGYLSVPAGYSTEPNIHLKNYMQTNFPIKKDCNHVIENIDYDRFFDFFRRMAENDIRDVTELFITALAGPWYADTILDGYPTIDIEKVFDSKNQITISILSTIDMKIIKGLLIRYHTEPNAEHRCKRKEDGTVECDIMIPYYVSKMPKEIQERFEKARDELLK